jgi:dihydrofolate synthase/folylpolyglutamate synthase
VVTQTLQHALEHLYGLERRRDKLGLDGTRALLEALGHPERRFRSVHVAGTNGKGSVCALIERVLREAGVTTGLFTSPHLVDFRERIRVRGRWADEDRLFEMLRSIEALPGGEERTFFEVATALGFEWFAERGVEWGVIEVGLGGRLDTTNVIEPALCVVTSIGLDHTEILGDTVEAVASEKAGIVKPGIPVVLGAGMDPRARETLALRALELGAPLVEVGEADFDSPGGFARWAARSGIESDARVLESAGPAAWEPRNAATALVAIAELRRAGVELGADAVRRGFAAARWPGRFERCPGRPRLWWDGAHNPHGLSALERAWSRAGLEAPGSVVLSLSRDKDLDSMLDGLARIAPGATLVATRSRSERALEPERIAARAAARGFQPRLAATVREGCELALALPGTSPVLLTGSLFAVGEAMEAFGGAPGEAQ